MNLRYGFNRFVRGTDTNPANHGFDLTSLGFPGSYQSLIGDDLRRFPRFDITGYQGTGLRRRVPSERDALVRRHPQQVDGRALAADRPRVPALPRRLDVLRERPDRAVLVRLDLDARAAGQLAGRARTARPVVRVVPARRAVLRADRAASELRRGLVHLRVLRAGRLARRPAPDAEPRAALRARDGADGKEQPKRPRLRCHRGAADGSRRQGRAEPGTDGDLAGAVQRAWRADVRRRQRPAARAVRNPEEQLDAAPRRQLQVGRQDRGACRLRRVLRLPRAAAWRRDHERLQLEHATHRVARQRPDLPRDLVEPLQGWHR